MKLRHQRILHVDGDAFFASCEIALDRSLEKRPVFVGGGRRGDGIVIAANYIDTTVFGKTEELHPLHSLEVQFSQRQPWGSIHGNLSWEQYWHSWDVHLIELFAGAEIRIVKGLSLNTSGSFARVRDQIYLSSVGLSEQEILTRQRARGTDYRFRFNFGLSYTFGATDNSIVNPRLDL